MARAHCFAHRFDLNIASIYENRVHFLSLTGASAAASLAALWCLGEKMTTDGSQWFREIAGHFSPGMIGSEIRWYETIDSTNREALALAPSEAIHGMVLLAGAQTRGRGRQGRSWMSTPGLGLYCTIVLRPRERHDIIPLLGLMAALAVHDALGLFCHAKRDIKWPNDVLIEGRKISGILGETATGRDGISHIALGIAINVNHGPHDFPEELRERAASIRMFEGTAPAFGDLLLTLLSEMNGWYERLLRDPAAIAAAVGGRSTWASGRRMKVEIPPHDVLTGTSAGINADGSLQLRLDSGIEIPLRAGDVHLL